MATCVAFGPNGSYFFNSPNWWLKHELPPAITALINDKPKTKEVHDLALGPDGSYVIVYQNDNNVHEIIHSDIPKTLENWLFPIPGKGTVRDPLSLSITLGPYGTYFAFDKNGSKWKKIPTKMERAIKATLNEHGRVKSGHYPQSVALGPDDAYVYITTGGHGHWNLDGQSDDLKKILEDSKSLKDIYIMLSPVEADTYMLLGANGYCDGNFPEGWQKDYNQFKTDWQQNGAPLPRTAAKDSHSDLASVGRSVVKHLKQIKDIQDAVSVVQTGVKLLKRVTK